MPATARIWIDEAWMTDVVLWINSGLAWALCEDGFYWLEAEVAVRQHGVMSGEPVFVGSRVPPKISRSNGSQAA